MRLESKAMATHITEQQIKLIGMRLNNSRPLGDVETLHNMAVEFGGLKLTAAQNNKGYSWLMNQWKTPRGIERKNNPFGYREQHVLENFSHIRYDGHMDAGNAYVSWYAPLYTVIAHDGGTFCYYVQGGIPQIIG
jgi:hypothetical protein